MKYLFIVILALTVSTYNIKNAKQTNMVKKPNISDTTNATKQIPLPDNQLISLLKANQIISNNYPDTALKLLNTEIIGEKKKFSTIQFSYDTCLQDLYESELVFNAMILYSNNELINSHVIDAVYKEDFTLLFSTEHYTIYEFYSSPVGYIIYYIFNHKNKHLFKSKPIEEGYVIDTSKINFKQKSIQTNFNNNHKGYSLTIVW